MLTQQPTVDDLVHNFGSLVNDDRIPPEVALVTAAETISRLAAIAREQQAQIEELNERLENLAYDELC